MEASAQFFLAKPSPLLEYPNSLPQCMSKDFLITRQSNLYKWVNSVLDAEQTLTPEQLSTLQWYYQILELVLLRPSLPPSLRGLIAEEAPRAAFNAMMQDYSSPSAHVLELTLVPKPEYVCRLLLWAQDAKVRLRYPETMYFPTLYGDFYWAHHFYTRRQPDHFFERMVRFNLDYASISGSAVLMLACLGSITEFNETQVQLLSQEPSIAFQAAIMFRRQLPLLELLREAVLEPQWAYHILTYIPDIPNELREMGMAVLEFHPPWLIEHIVATKLNVTDKIRAKALIARSLDSGHPLCEDLRLGLTPDLFEEVRQ